MKIVGVCGSPRKGNSEFLLREALDAAKKAGADTELILLREKKVGYCDGCDGCQKDETRGKCHVQDDMQEIYPKLESADGIIVASPNYYSNVSGLLKNFIDRTLIYYGNEKLSGKVAGIIAVGAGSAKEPAEVIKNFLTSREVVVRGVVHVVAFGAGEVAKNKKALEEARKLGEKIARR